ncbi:MAG: hypothetical protein ABIP94_08455 [Planctomycetota bacterium]
MPLRAIPCLPGLLLALFLLPPTPAQVPEASPPRFDIGNTLGALAEHVSRTDELELSLTGKSWQLLALLQNGSTLRSGPHREPIKKLVLWLRSTQAEDGRFAPGGVPCGALEQTVAAMAMVSAYGLSNYKLLQANAENAVDAIERAMSTATEPSPPELGAMLALLGTDVAGATALPPEQQTRVKTLAKQVLAQHTFGKTRRADAALHLGQLLLGEPFLPELTVARMWPANLAADPLQTVFALFAMRHCEAKVWSAQTDLLPTLLAARTPAGDAGTWPAAAGFDAMTSTAMLAMAFGIANQPQNGLRPK